MKKIRLSWKLFPHVFHREDKEAIEKWKNLEFTIKKPSTIKDHLEEYDYKLKKDEIYFKNWNAGI